jgi:nudix-type nucleoside diphosphatase (YffH/AdpP family)
MPAQIINTTTLYDGWIKVLRVRLRLNPGEEVERDVEDHGRGIAVLPYDPVRRVALLVRLPRAPVLLAGEKAELLEVPAGYVEESEPAETARRELYEETGLKVSRVDHVGQVWISPGISTDRLDLYLAPYSIGDRVSPGGGAEGEHEKITVVEVPLAELWTSALSKEIADMKTLALVMMLHAQKPELFTVPG